MINLLLINGVFGMWGLLGALGASWLLYHLISKGKGANRTHWGQVAAIALGHALGVVTVVKAPWGSPMLTGVAVIMELFIVAIFVGIGRR